MLNRIVLMGRLTRDPELRYTKKDTAVVSFSLAVDRDFKDKNNGERTTDFIDVIAWRNTAEFIRKYFKKGSMAVIEGRLQSESWTDDKGNKRKVHKVVADTIYFGDSKKDEGKKYTDNKPVASENKSDPDEEYRRWAEGRQQEQFTELNDDEGELPF